MSKRAWAALVLAATLPLTLMTTGSDAAPKDEPGKAVFGPDKVWKLHIEMTPQNFTTMQPKKGAGFPLFGMKAPDKATDDARDVHHSAFGTEFSWVKGTLSWDGKVLPDIGFRYKGNSTYLSSAKGLKRSIKVEPDHYDEAGRWLGLKTVNLNCAILDPSKIREALVYAIYRAGGVPAPRTAFAEVTLTVPGKYDRELVGLYTMIEQADKMFLKDRFKNNKGLLLKPERIQGLPYFGDDWDRYKAQYQPRQEPTPEQAKRFIEFVKLVNKGSDEEFNKQIEAYLDIDLFLRYLGVTALVANLDSFFALGHNYFMYLNPETNKVVFMPWDVDLAMGNFAMLATPEQQMDLNLRKPYGGANRLTDRLLAKPGMLDRYEVILKDVVAKAFTKEKLAKLIDTMETTTKDILARDLKAAAARGERGGVGAGAGVGIFGGKTPDPRTFVAKRIVSVQAQLAGLSSGTNPGGAKPTSPARRLVRAFDDDRDSKLSKTELEAGLATFFKDADAAQTGKLDEAALAAAVNKAVVPAGTPVGFGGGPGRAYAGPILKRADKNGDGKVTLAELQAAAATLLAEVDKEKKGTLEEKDITVALGLLVP